MFLTKIHVQKHLRSHILVFSQNVKEYCLLHTDGRLICTGINFQGVSGRLAKCVNNCILYAKNRSICNVNTCKPLSLQPINTGMNKFLLGKNTIRNELQKHWKTAICSSVDD